MKVGAINFSELGTKCWDPARMGSECKRVQGCPYAIKNHCKAFVTTRNYKVQIVRVGADGSKQILNEYETTKPLKEPTHDK